MSERATAYSIHQTASTPTGATEMGVRPKVLRRPAHFGAGSAASIASPEPTFIPLAMAETSDNKPAPAPARAWQDDGKFAITLLALVIVVNLIVSGWLAAITPAPLAKPAVAQAPVDTAPPASGATVHVLDTSTRDISEQ